MPVWLGATLGALLAIAVVVFWIGLFVIVMRKAFGRRKPKERVFGASSPLHDLSVECGARGCGKRHTYQECTSLNDEIMSR